MVESVRVHADAAVTVSCAFSGALGSAAKIDLPFTMDVSRGGPGGTEGGPLQGVQQGILRGR
ncbi:hypothetical protein [Thermogymnomonas acidicola]|uniref:hypothetical protein n=1 Tax=Thermogymnomonas acidicola TaxID=399579 RepID=UPI00149409E5|nr:hypothetical protein [Thermogymnomonas acidicola]